MSTAQPQMTAEERRAYRESGAEYADFKARNRARHHLPRVKQRNSALVLRDKEVFAVDPRIKGRLLVKKAAMRAKQKGIEHSITAEDIVWPTHCSVLGIELDYGAGDGSKKGPRPNSPSLDRWNNEIGYTPKNTVVISWRANSLKGNGTWQELYQVAYYAQYGRSLGSLEEGLE